MTTTMACRRSERHARTGRPTTVWAHVLVAFFAAIAIALANGPTAAGSLRVKLADPAGKGAGSKPRPGVDVRVTNLETGDKTYVRTNKRGIAYFKGLEGHYEIRVQKQGAFYTTYRVVKAEDRVSIRPRSNGLPAP